MAKALYLWLVTSLLLFASVTTFFTEELPTNENNFDFHKQIYNSYDENNKSNINVILISN